MHDYWIPVITFDMVLLVPWRCCCQSCFSVNSVLKHPKLFVCSGLMCDGSCWENSLERHEFRRPKNREAWATRKRVAARFLLLLAVAKQMTRRNKPRKMHVSDIPCWIMCKYQRKMITNLPPMAEHHFWCKNIKRSCKISRKSLENTTMHVSNWQRHQRQVCQNAIRRVVYASNLIHLCVNDLACSKRSQRDQDEDDKDDWWQRQAIQFNCVLFWHEIVDSV